MKIKEAVQQKVNEIYQHQGQVTPSALVETAKPKTSPIHNAFEWDNKKAGQEYRLWQARQWIRRVEIIVEDRPEKLIHVPRIEPDPTTNEGYYKPASVIVNMPDEYQAAKMAMVGKLNAAQEALDQLERAASSRTEKPEADFDRAKNGFKEVREALAV